MQISLRIKEGSKNYFDLQIRHLKQVEQGQLNINNTILIIWVYKELLKFFLNIYLEKNKIFVSLIFFTLSLEYYYTN